MSTAKFWSDRWVSRVASSELWSDRWVSRVASSRVALSSDKPKTRDFLDNPLPHIPLPAHHHNHAPVYAIHECPTPLRFPLLSAWYD